MARPSTWALGALAVGLLGLAGSLLEAVLADQNRALGLLQTQTLTRQLGLLGQHGVGTAAHHLVHHRQDAGQRHPHDDDEDDDEEDDE